ncbi:unnamed protein product [Cuscuta campestris]|uniref:Uncharacterized protein n=1 Tax=Cuscuta campestris TaxID=132261 RepID=A0A484KAH7_9ASTE|nr:unnamed protein product [Cuscuta campestris]
MKDGIIISIICSNETKIGAEQDAAKQAIVLHRDAFGYTITRLDLVSRTPIMNPEYNDPTPVMDPQYIDVPKLDKLVNRVYGTGSNSEMANAHNVLCDLQTNPIMWTRVDKILFNTKNLNTKFFALHVSFKISSLIEDEILSCDSPMMQ